MICRRCFRSKRRLFLAAVSVFIVVSVFALSSRVVNWLTGSDSIEDPFPDIAQENETRPEVDASLLKYVIILTYQRCGSSFFGNIFNLNPDAFYTFEPLDSLYSSLYGTTPGWNVPSDITHYANGSARSIPQMEVDAVSDFLFHLLTGNVDRLPTQTLLHKFWFSFAKEQKQALNYFKCLQTHSLTDYAECYRHIHVYCGSRFGEKSPERHRQCNRLLTNDEKNSSTVTAQRFSKYRSCFQTYRRRVDADCMPVLRKAIAVRRLRATKLVRATMDSMGSLLRALPSLRIIHLVRDPRAVARSRISTDQSLRSAYSLRTRNSSFDVDSLLVDEASIYCRHATLDIRARLALERQYPGRILLMRYEDVVTNPERRFRDVYEFLDEPVLTTALAEMQESAQQARTRNVLTKWQFNMTYAEGIAIARRCAEFYRLLNISAIDV